MDYGLEGRVALVTGGSEGIGKATALALSIEGVRVAICARRPNVLDATAEEIRTISSGEILAVPTDISKPEQITNLMQRVNEKWGGVDIARSTLGSTSLGPGPSSIRCEGINSSTGPGAISHLYSHISKGEGAF